MGKRICRARLPDGTYFHYINRMEMLFSYKEIFTAGAYESPLITIKDDDVILDVGANVGLFLHYVSRRCARSTLYAFEPIPRIYAALCENARLFLGHDVRLFSCGLSDHCGEATFTYLPYVTARSTMYPQYSPSDDSPESTAREVGFMLQTFQQLPRGLLRGTIAVLPPPLRRLLAFGAVKLHGVDREVTCPLTTVSRVIDEQRLTRIDLLKIDVEGAERDVLRGIRDEHWPLIRQVILETHPGPGDVLGDVRGILEAHGLRTSVSDQTLHPAPTVFAAQA